MINLKEKVKLKLTTLTPHVFMHFECVNLTAPFVRVTKLGVSRSLHDEYRP